MRYLGVPIGEMSVKAKVNEIITIEKKSNPTTGFTWRLKAPDAVKFESEYVPDEVPEGFCGAGGKQIFRLLCSEPGTYTVKFVYARPWEKEVAETETVEITFE